MEPITRDELKQLIDSKGEYVLIDVRDKEELEYGMIPTAHHLPLGELDDALDLSPDEFELEYGFRVTEEDNIIFYCRTGGRSAQAAAMAVEKGFERARNFMGSVQEWSEIDENVKMY